jgi:hypothetical protein
VSGFESCYLNPIVDAHDIWVLNPLLAKQHTKSDGVYRARLRRLPIESPRACELLASRCTIFLLLEQLWAFDCQLG